ncbi:MAG: tetratricopeptide repeat protein [Myxococcales bacterium]|nr:tetratricopeptide repeat protein [Myxococcales bacterium]
MKLRIAALSIVASAASLTACVTPEVSEKKDVVVAPPPPPKVASPKENFDKGVAAFDANNLDEANTLFTKVAEKVPTSLVTQYNLAVIAERQGRLTDAQVRYEAAHKIDGKHKPTLLNLGRVYRLQDKFAEAIALYEEALKDNEFDVELNNNLTVAYRLAKNYTKAEETARRVLSRTKDNPDAYKNLALIYFDQGNYRLAEFISANAKKLDDKDPGVYNNLGLIYLKLDEKRLALAQFQKAVTLNKDFAPSLFNIGAMALSYRDYVTAEKSLSRTTELDPTRYENFLAYAWSLDGQKGKDAKKGIKAGEIFEKVLSLKTDQNDAVCGAAWAYAADKTGWDKALGFFEKCKGLTTTSAQDQTLIDNKVKGILAMQKSGQKAEQPAPEKPKAAPTGGPSMLDKAEKEAEKDAPPPAEGAPAPAPGATPPAEAPKTEAPKKDAPKEEAPKAATPPAAAPAAAPAADGAKAEEKKP